MKKPNITQGEWSISDFRPRVGVLKYDRLAITPVCDFDREFDWMDDPDMKAISAVPNALHELENYYYLLKNLISSNINVEENTKRLNDVESVLIKAGYKL